MSSAAPPRLRTGFVLSATPKHCGNIKSSGHVLSMGQASKVDSRVADVPFVDTATSVRVSV